MERELVDWLRQRIPAHRAVPIGLGDDAAVVDLGAPNCVVTVDVLTDGVDFELRNVDPRRVGRKALAVNLSDLAAMAARPVAAVVGLVLPRNGGLELAQGIYEGLLPLAEQYNVAIAGGDTNAWDGGLVISVTAFGTPSPRGVWRRCGAKPGDVILVTGAFGGSILGKHFDFEPRVNEALLLAERYDIHAAIDVSDGLSLDLSRLLAESGCGGVLDLQRVPLAPAAERLADERRDGVSPLDHALGDGEDFELILTAPPDAAAQLLGEQPLGVPITAIGECGDERGLWALRGSSRVPLVPRGYLH